MHENHVQCTEILRLPFDKLRDRLTQSSGTGSLKAQGPAHSKLRDWLTHRVTCGQVDKSIPHQHAGGNAAFEGQFGFFHLHNGHRALGNHAHAATGQQSVSL